MDAFISGLWRTPTRAEIFTGGGWRSIGRAEIYKDGAWRQCLSFRSPLTLVVAPSSVSGLSTPDKPVRQLVTSNTTAATPSGGTPPYSYAWTASGVTVTRPTLAYTEFQKNMAANEEVTGTAQVVCTDALGTTAIGSVEYYLYNQANGDFA